MTDTQLTIIIAAIPATVAAIGALAATIIAAMKSSERGIRAEIKADDLLGKTAEIHTLTNSNLTKVQGALDVALAKIEGLQTMVAAMVHAKAIADKLAEIATPPEVKTINEPSNIIPAMEPNPKTK
jgi:hypothetical protein